MTTKTLTPRQVRWANFLSQLNFMVRYRPGKKNGKADYLSRLPGGQTEGGDENLNFRFQRILKDEILDLELRKIAHDLNTLIIAVDDVYPPAEPNEQPT